MSLEHLDYTAVWPEDYFLDDEDDVAESDDHARLIEYIIGLLTFLFLGENYYIGRNLLILQPGFSPIAPDVFLAKFTMMLASRRGLKSWNVSQANRPVPAIVFEISSEKTWKQDLNEKIVRYAQLGVKEYIACDPNTPKVWQNEKSRIKGWRYDNGVVQELQEDDQGQLWSSELASYLKFDGDMLKMYDRQGNLRLTHWEASEQEAEAARQRAEAARQRAEAAEQAKEVIQTDMQAILEKLRRNNIDLDKLQ